MFVLLVLLAGISLRHAESLAVNSWVHDWITPSSSLWGYGAMNGLLFSDDDVAFIAKTYRVVAISACLGSINTSVADAIMSVAARIKAQNANVRVLQYFNMQQWACYNRDVDPDYKVFLANPQWWLLDDSGAPVINNGSPQYDWQNPAAVAHWLQMPIELNGTTLLDGFLLDGAAVYQTEANINAQRTEALKLAKWRAVGQMQQRLSDANGGLCLANGMAGGGIDPFVPSDPFNLGVLNFTDGVENERGTPTFEYVDPLTGAFRLDAIAANLAAVEVASNEANGTKAIFVNYWAGPITGFSQYGNTSGWPTYAPDDASNRTPNGTKAEVVRGWSHLLETWLPFNLASFLTVAGPSTYFTQMVWYAAFQGFLPCPTAPDSCCTPQPFYPELFTKSLGAPAGPRQQVGAYRWVRHFEHAVVTLDLTDPLGPGTSIVWS